MCAPLADFICCGVRVSTSVLPLVQYTVYFWAKESNAVPRSNTPANKPIDNANFMFLLPVSGFRPGRVRKPCASFPGQ